MPEPRMKFVQSEDIAEVRNLRLPGMDKAFEDMTIGELLQLRPGGDVQDSYDVEAFTDNASYSTSSIVAEMAKLRGTQAMKAMDRIRRLPNTDVIIR